MRLKNSSIMKFLINTVSESDKSRHGKFIKDANTTIETPLLLLHTQAGSVPYLAPDILQSVIGSDEQALQISVSTTGGMLAGCTAFGKGITKYAGLGSTLNCLTLKNPSSYSPSGFHEKDIIPVFNKNGKINYSVSNYMDIVESFQPDIYHTLCDGDTFDGCSKKRVLKAVERSESMFIECLERHQKSDVLRNSMLIAPLEGGYDLPSRLYMIRKILEHDKHIDGYLIDGLHTNGPNVTAMGMKQMEEVVTKTIELIPEDKPRFLFGPFNPVTVLELIQAGIDVMDSSYPYLATISSRALTFNFNLENSVDVDFDLDLSDPSFKEDFTSILEGCTCLACQKHTRAYVNHLVNTRELLAPILLMIHNLHHYLGYFNAIRSAISNKRFPDLVNLVKTQIGTDRQYYDLTKLQEELKDTTNKNPSKKPKKRNLDDAE